MQLFYLHTVIFFFLGYEVPIVEVETSTAHLTTVNETEPLRSEMVVCDHWSVGDAVSGTLG